MDTEETLELFQTRIGQEVAQQMVTLSLSDLIQSARNFISLTEQLPFITMTIVAPLVRELCDRLEHTQVQTN